MDKAAMSLLEELFTFGCPKFINPMPIDYSSGSTTARSVLNLQVQTFLREISQQALVPPVRSYLRLYSSIRVSKLANYLSGGVDEDAVRSALMNVMHKSTSLEWHEGAPLTGERKTKADLDFAIADEMIHISEKPVEKTDVFLDNISQLNTALQRLQATSSIEEIILS
eukprot:TRINITY_DN1108_c0_g2_i4.p1 TRINITY_DN1108_c0_g2~~TRINITY_DN1108_c0_g2_i4.p1  ORF type:complete len:182 (-),score=22.58 TRINITY_DN1108_c0_g2_i4:55-558(-)